MYRPLPDTDEMGSLSFGALLSALVVFCGIIATILYFIVCFDDELGKAILSHCLVSINSLDSVVKDSYDTAVFHVISLQQM